MNSRWNYLLLKKTFSDPTCGFACSFGSTETWQYKGQQLSKLFGSRLSSPVKRVPHPRKTEKIKPLYVTRFALISTPIQLWLSNHNIQQAVKIGRSAVGTWRPSLVHETTVSGRLHHVPLKEVRARNLRAVHGGSKTKTNTNCYIRASPAL